ncbi:Na(+)/citrate cotransporter-like isoform X2 [Babylonia areolata]
MGTDVIRQLWSLRAPVLTAVVIIVFLPLALSDLQYVRCAYVVLVMAVLWLTEAIPIPATALLPVVLFPACGVYEAKEVSGSYVNDSSMLFMGGLILAVAVEEWGLHKRVAIGVLRIVGADPKFVMLGLMLPTWFLSMWISNTATASMMIPIANAVAAQMGSVQKGDEGDRETNAIINGAPSGTQTASQTSAEKYTHHGDSATHTKSIQIDNTVNTQREGGGGRGEQPSESIHMQQFTDTSVVCSPPAGDLPTVGEQVVEGDGVGSVSREDPDYLMLCKGLSLCIAYGCNIGGIATLTGTPPNLVFKGQADDFFNDRYKNLSMDQVGAGVTFANWMGMALPMSAIVLLLGWVLLMVMFLRTNMCRKISIQQKEGVRKVIMQEWNKLGPMRMAEVEILVLFVFLAIMWISRDPKETPGWGSWFMSGYVKDSSAAMLVAVLLFIVPARVPRVFCLRGPEHSDEPFYVPLLTWEQVHRKLPWGVILLLGGGFALANACKASGLSDWLGDQLISLRSLDPWVLNLILCLIVATATEVTSNTATSTLLMPIMAQIALNVGVNPLYLMASAAMATSFAFMLPVATPPNAIVFSYGHLRVIDMASVGFFMNIIAVLVLTLAVNTWGEAIFNFSQVPAIFDKSLNLTSTA